MMQKDSINKGQLLLLIQDYFSFLLEKIKVIFGFLVVGLIIGISYAILKKPTYEAKLVFMLNDSKSVNMG
ncbi:MAG: lipopolysaccharide biosynthesis protein, partial [Bacteroidia bacterium]